MKEKSGVSILSGSKEISEIERIAIGLTQAEIRLGLSRTAAIRLNAVRCGTYNLQEFLDQPPTIKQVFFYYGDRVKGRVDPEGESAWTIDGDSLRKPGRTMPIQEIKDLSYSFDNYLASKQGKRLLFTMSRNDDQRHVIERIYTRRGFVFMHIPGLTEDTPPYMNFRLLVLDNRIDKSSPPDLVKIGSDFLSKYPPPGTCPVPL